MPEAERNGATLPVWRAWVIRRMWRCGLLGLLIFYAIIFQGLTAFAGHPLGTEDSGTLGRGRAEMEFNFEAGKFRKDKEYTIGNILTLGVVDRLDFSVEYSYLFLRPKDGVDVDGFGDTGLFLKWSIPLPATPNAQAGIKLGAIVPSGDENRGTGSGAKDYEGRFILERGIDVHKIFVNLAYLLTGDRPGGVNPGDLFRASLAVETEASGRGGFATVAEIEYETAESSGAEDIVSVLGGLIFSLTERSDLSFGVKSTLRGSGPDVLFTSGLTIGF